MIYFNKEDRLFLTLLLMSCMDPVKRNDYSTDITQNYKRTYHNPNGRKYCRRLEDCLMDCNDIRAVRDRRIGHTYEKNLHIESDRQYYYIKECEERCRLAIVCPEEYDNEKREK